MIGVLEPGLDLGPIEGVAVIAAEVLVAGLGTRCLPEFFACRLVSVGHRTAMRRIMAPAIRGDLRASDIDVVPSVDVDINVVVVPVEVVPTPDPSATAIPAPQKKPFTNAAPG